MPLASVLAAVLAAGCGQNMARNYAVMGGVISGIALVEASQLDDSGERLGVTPQQWWLIGGLSLGALFEILAIREAWTSTPAAAPATSRRPQL